MIETKRLIFRRWTKEDAAALYALASDPEVGPMLVGRYIHLLKKAER